MLLLFLQRLLALEMCGYEKEASAAHASRQKATQVPIWAFSFMSRGHESKIKYEIYCNLIGKDWISVSTQPRDWLCVTFKAKNKTTKKKKNRFAPLQPGNVNVALDMKTWVVRCLLVITFKRLSEHFQASHGDWASVWILEVTGHLLPSQMKWSFIIIL